MTAQPLMTNAPTPAGIYGVGFNHNGGGFADLRVDGQTYSADQVRKALAAQPSAGAEPVAVIAFREGRREPELLSWNAMPIGEHRLYARPAPVQPDSGGVVEAYVIAHPTKKRRIVDARRYDPTSDAFWVSPAAKAEHTITPLAALAPVAAEGEVEPEAFDRMMAVLENPPLASEELKAHVRALRFLQSTTPPAAQSEGGA